MSFQFPMLLWGLPLIAVPMLIHLINMLRQRRIQWAAMEFLLQSQKRNRTWVLLKQLLLLLLRMAAIAGVVLMVAQPVLRNAWGAIFGGARVHHIVLLDDSFSMSDRWGGSSAFQRGVDAVQRLGEQVSQQNAVQNFTLLRFSHIKRGAHDTQLDLANVPVDGTFKNTLDDLCRSMQVSQFSQGPAEALEAISNVTRDVEGETRVIYIVSDFRAKEWQNPKDLRKKLLELSESKAKIELIDCVSDARPNLAITDLQAIGGTRAAGVPLKMSATVTNYSAVAAENVAIHRQEDGVEVPALKIEKIGPNRSVSREFQVNFLTAGQHRIEVHLDGDAVAADNARYAVVDFAREIPVLVIDGDLQAGSRVADSSYLNSALAPPGRTPTGIKPQIEPPRYLRERPLAGFYAIYLLNVERLDQSAIEALEQFARNGGGVAFFVGELTQPVFYNQQLYRGGEGLFPVPLAGPTDLLVERADKAPDLDVTHHPVFKVFEGQGNPALRMVNIERYMAVQRGWKPADGSTTKVIAKLRNGAPLAIEREFGAGRVVAFMTTVAPRWNNWGRDNPSFVVALQELQAYLSSPKQVTNDREVGTPLQVAVDLARYQPHVAFVKPKSDDNPVETAANSPKPVAAADATSANGVTDANHFKRDAAAIVDAVKSDQGWVATFDDTETSGFYQAKLASSQSPAPANVKDSTGGKSPDKTETSAGAGIAPRADDDVETRFFAVNVSPVEGDLSIVDAPALASRLKDVNYVLRHAEDLNFESRDLDGSNASRWVLYALVLLLLGEQLLAYSASYHPTRREALA